MIQIKLLIWFTHCQFLVTGLVIFFPNFRGIHTGTSIAQRPPRLLVEVVAVVIMLRILRLSNASAFRFLVFGTALAVASCQPPAAKSGAGKAPAFAPGPGGAGDADHPIDSGSPSPVPAVPAQAILAPSATQPLTLSLPAVPVAYDFKGTLDREASTAAVMRLVVQSGRLKESKSVRLSGKIKNLRNGADVKNLDVKAAVDSRGVIDVSILGLAPDTVYRVNDLQIADEATQASERIKDPYFFATTGESRVSKVRRKIVLKALAEAYDWDNSNYDRSKGYGNSAGWCDRFYTWSASDYTTLTYPKYAPSYFKSNGGLKSSIEISSLGAQESLAGDMVRYDAFGLGNHTFMIVALDQATGKLETVEGNFNNRVMRSSRSVQGAFMLGHLSDALIR